MFTKVGANDILIVSDLIGYAVGDSFPMVQNNNMIGYIHDDAHVVLDEDHGRSELIG